LKALKQAGLVEDVHPDFDARVRVYSLRSGSLDALKVWLGETEALWSDQLLALKRHIEGDGSS
jgi:DNA-binding transcriptional ArsR family regulator